MRILAADFGRMATIPSELHERPGHLSVPLFGRGGVVRGHALVDVDDLPLVNATKWFMHSGGYAYGWTARPDRKCLLMHRVITRADDGVEVDHVNRDRLDNRRSNLRLATRAQNAQNLGADRSNNVSGARGVARTSKGKPWRAVVKMGGRQSYLGSFDTVEAADAVVSRYRSEHMEYAS